jgi:hypothetical protein
MSLKALCATHALAAIVWSGPASAQEVTPQATPEQAVAPAERVIVKVAGPEREIRGRLLRLDSQALSLQLDDRRVDFPVDQVLQIDVVRRDSVINGAIFGALYAAACMAWWCQQGLDSSTGQGPLDAVAAIGMGALVGAGIDVLFNKRTTVFKAGNSPGPQPFNAAVSFRVRF